MQLLPILLAVPYIHLQIEVLRRPVEFAQYTSIAFTAHLAAEGIVPSIGTVGDALDNALMESAVGLYKTELIARRGPWRDLAHVEMETAGYLHWFNHRRIHSAIGDITPAEAEAAWYAAHGGTEEEQ